MNKFFEWFGRNRKAVIYTVAGMNLLGGIATIASGNTTNGMVGLFLGAVLVVDTMTTK